MSPTSAGASPDYLSIILRLKKSAGRLRSLTLADGAQIVVWRRRCTADVPDNRQIIIRNSIFMP